MFEILSDALDAAEKEFIASKAILVEDFREKFAYGGINYGESKTSHTEILTIKGKKTRKYFHVIITRLETGCYELVSYIS